MSSDDAPDLTTSVSRPALALLAQYGRRHASRLIVGAVAQTFGRMTGLAPVFILGVAVDAIFTDVPYRLPLVPPRWIPEAPMDQLWFTGGVLGVVFVANLVLKVLADWGWYAFSERVQHDLRTDAYDAIQRLDLVYFEHQQTGEIVSVLNNDVDALEGFLVGNVRTTIQLAAFITVAFGYLAILNLQLAIVAMSLVIPVGIVSRRVANVWRTLGSEIREYVGALNARLEANVSGVEVVKAHAAEQFERERVASVSADLRDAGVRGGRAASVHEPASRVTTRIGVAIILFFGGYWVVRGPPWPFTATMTAGALIPFVSYLRSLHWRINQITGIIRGYHQANAAAERVLGVQRADLTVSDAPDADLLGDVEGAVAYDDVTYQYPATDAPAVDSVSFEIQPGETVGVVGPTGAGKTTLVKLLPRFYDPDAGTIHVDGLDISTVTRDSLREAIGYVDQEPFMFNGTIRENVTYGTPGADDETLESAARAAGAHEFIVDLDEGYDTEIGERGVKLSGGQRQRLVIARALVRDPGILILDEATSHVDNETEAVIQARMEEIVADRTTIIIAHRLSTVRNADRILVIDEGCLIEQGNHEELLQQAGLYATLWSVQAGQLTEPTG